MAPSFSAVLEAKDPNVDIFSSLLSEEVFDALLAASCRCIVSTAYGK